MCHDPIFYGRTNCILPCQAMCKPGLRPARQTSHASLTKCASMGKATSPRQCLVPCPHACCICYAALQDEVVAEVADMSWGSFKPVLTEAVVEHLRPVQSK